eukprot:6459522-Amphidinium_carterae.1
MTKHPRFADLLQGELLHMDSSLRWPDMWTEFKVCLASVAKHIEELPDIDTSSCHLRYTACMRCLRAWRHNRASFRCVLNRCGWVHVSAMTDVAALQWIRSTCKAARAEMLQEEAHAEFAAESTESPSLKSDFLLKMLTHWRRQQWAGQPGVAHCSTVGEERLTMARHWESEFVS